MSINDDDEDPIIVHCSKTKIRYYGVVKYIFFNVRIRRAQILCVSSYIITRKKQNFKIHTRSISEIALFRAKRQKNSSKYALCVL